MKKLIPILFAASIAAYAQSPYITTTFPAGGSGTTATITADGAFSSASQALYILLRFDGSNHGCDVLVQVQYSSVFYLLSDDGSTWGSSSSIGSGPTLQNSQCIVPASGIAGYLAGGNIAAANVSATFKSAFSGVRAISAQAYSLDGTVSPWYNGGSWTVPGSSCPPGVTGISPFNGSGSSQAFTISTTDACAGAANIQYIWLRVGAPGPDHSHDCDALWMLQDNTIHLLSDDGTNWNIGGPFGGSGTISNSQCSIPLSTAGKSIVGSTVSGSATIIPVGSYSGTKEISGTVAGYNSLGWNWFTAGNWTIPPMDGQIIGYVKESQPTLNPGEINMSRITLSQAGQDVNTMALRVYHINDPVSFRIRFAKPNTQVWAREQAIEEGQTMCPQYTGVVAAEGACLLGSTDSNGFFQWDGQIKPLTSMRTVQFYIGAQTPNAYDPFVTTLVADENTYVGALVYFVIGAGELPVPPVW